MPYHPEKPISSRRPLGPGDDIGRGWYGIWYGFAMFYTLYHIFKQESIQGMGTIKGRGMIKGRHLTLYQIFKSTVFTTKYMIYIKCNEVTLFEWNKWNKKYQYL
jgi:hypothetical protein